MNCKINYVFFLSQQSLDWKYYTSLEQHPQQLIARTVSVMENQMVTMLFTPIKITFFNAPRDWLTVKPAGLWVWNSVKTAINVCTANTTSVSPQRNGTLPLPSNVQTNVPFTDHLSVETLLTQETHDNTLLAGKELQLDVLLVQEIWSSTNNGTPVFTKESTKLPQLMSNN